MMQLIKLFGNLLHLISIRSFSNEVINQYTVINNASNIKYKTTTEHTEQTMASNCILWKMVNTYFTSKDLINIQAKYWVFIDIVHFKLAVAYEWMSEMTLLSNKISLFEIWLQLAESSDFHYENLIHTTYLCYVFEPAKSHSFLGTNETFSVSFVP